MSRTQTPLPAHDDVGAGRGSDEVSGPSLGSSVPGEVVSGPLTSMPPNHAALVRANAWPTWMKAMDDDYLGRGCFLLRTCHCGIGRCVPCSRDGRHDRCLTRQHDGRPLGWDMAIYAWTRGRQPIDGRKVATVTVAGRSCRWTCPCGCWPKPAPLLEPAELGQLAFDLFALEVTTP